MKGLDRPVVCVALMDWKVNWQREQQLMSRFSDETPVLYLEQPFSLAGLAKKGFREFGRLKAWWKGTPTKVRSNVWTVTPPPSVFPMDKIPVVNHLYYLFFRRWLRKVSTGLGMRDPILWITQPRSAPLIGHLDESLVVVDWCNTWEEHWAGILLKGDLWLPLRRLNVRWKRYWMEFLLSNADVVFTNAYKYYEEARKYNSQVFFVPSGADVAHFARSVDDQVEIPDDLQAIGPVRIGAICARINSHIVDYDAVAALARQHPDWHVVFIGAVAGSLHPLDKLPNVHIIGYRPYDRLPAYLKGFDVCLIPYCVNTTTQSGVPTKLPEYLAAGKPVVSTYLMEIEKVSDLAQHTFLARTSDEFVKGVEQVLTEDSPAKRSERIAAAMQHSWNAKAEYMAHVIACAVLAPENSAKGRLG